MAADSEMHTFYANQLPKSEQNIREGAWGGVPEINAASKKLNRYIIVWVNDRFLRDMGIVPIQLSTCGKKTGSL